MLDYEQIHYCTMDGKEIEGYYHEDEYLLIKFKDKTFCLIEVEYDNYDGIYWNNQSAKNIKITKENVDRFENGNYFGYGIMGVLYNTGVINKEWFIKEAKRVLDLKEEEDKKTVEVDFFNNKLDLKYPKIAELFKTQEFITEEELIEKIKEL